MFGWLFKKREVLDEEKIQKGFGSVKKDMETVGKWIKHLDGQDKQLLDSLNELKRDIASINDEIASLREGIDLAVEEAKTQQMFEKTPVSKKQTDVYAVEEGVETGVQTGSFYGILKGLSGNERLVIFTLLNSEMKLSYEDLALLLGKERSTIRGLINRIKQKSEGIIEEISEKNGKKRVFIPDEIKQKLQKYAKVRVSKGDKVRLKKEKEIEESE